MSLSHSVSSTRSKKLKTATQSRRRSRFPSKMQSRAKAMNVCVKTPEQIAKKRLWLDFLDFTIFIYNRLPEANNLDEVDRNSSDWKSYVKFTQLYKARQDWFKPLDLLTKAYAINRKIKCLDFDDNDESSKPVGWMLSVLPQQADMPIDMVVQYPLTYDKVMYINKLNQEWDIKNNISEL